MIKVPFYLAIVLILAYMLKKTPDWFKEKKYYVIHHLLFFFLTGAFCLTIFFRMIKKYIIEPILAKWNPDPWVPDPDAPVIIGQAGSTWTASKQGASSLKLFWLSLSDPNTALYIIPSCILNILFFMPLGMLLPCAFPALREKKILCILTGFGLSLLFEVLQTVTRLGMGDWKDLVCNTLGTLLGYLMWSRYIEKGWVESETTN